MADALSGPVLSKAFPRILHNSYSLSVVDLDFMGEISKIKENSVIKNGSLSVFDFRRERVLGFALWSILKNNLSYEDE